jgi:hypothetical protein
MKILIIYFLLSSINSLFIKNFIIKVQNISCIKNSTLFNNLYELNTLFNNFDKLDPAVQLFMLNI